MARVKIKEYKAKQLIYPLFNSKPDIFSVEGASVPKLDEKKTYVVKVDQGIKGRLNKGLVSLNKKASEIRKILENYKQKGYSSFFIEEYIPHSPKDELYISIERVAKGKNVLYSNKGGIDIEK